MNYRIIEREFDENRRLSGTCPVIRTLEPYEIICSSLGMSKAETRARAVSVLNAITNYDALVDALEKALPVLKTAVDLAHQRRDTANLEEMHAGLNAVASVLLNLRKDL